MLNKEEVEQAGKTFKDKILKEIFLLFKIFIIIIVCYILFRVKAGVCYHLYSKAREMALDQYPLPEMLRTRLEEVILQIKMLQLGKARTFLASVMDPPNMKAIDLSLDLLRTLNALDDEEQLTPLGYHLAQLPLDPRTGTIFIY